jgi:hypothetical protein
VGGSCLDTFDVHIFSRFLSSKYMQELSRGVVVQLLPSTTLPPLIYRLVRGVVPLGGIRVRLAASIQAPQIGSIHVGAFPGDLLPVSRVDHGWLKLHPAAYSILQSSRSFSAHDPFEDGWCLLQSGAAAAGERSYFEMASLQVEKCWPGSTIQKLESQITAVILNYNPGRVTILQTAFDEVKASNVANPVGALTELYLKTCELFASASNKRPFDLFMDELSIEDDPYSELNSVASTLSPDTIASPTFEPIAAFGAPGPAQSTAPPLTAAQSLLGIGTIDKWVGIFKETQTTIDVEQVRLSPLSQKWRDVVRFTPFLFIPFTSRVHIGEWCISGFVSFDIMLSSSKISFILIAQAAATKEIFIAAYNGEEGIVRRCIYDGARTDDYRDNVIQWSKLCAEPQCTTYNFNKAAYALCTLHALRNTPEIYMPFYRSCNDGVHQRISHVPYTAFHACSHCWELPHLLTLRWAIFSLL